MRVVCSEPRGRVKGPGFTVWFGLQGLQLHEGAQILRFRVSGLFSRSWVDRVFQLPLEPEP